MIQNVNNQPNFRAGVISSIRMDRLLGEETIAKLKTKGDSNIYHTLKEIQQGTNQGRIYLESENEKTGRRTKPEIFKAVGNFRDKILERSGISAEFLERAGKKVVAKKKAPSSSSQSVENTNNIYELASKYLENCKRKNIEGSGPRFVAMVLEKGPEPQNFIEIQKRANRLDELGTGKSKFLRKIVDMILSNPDSLNPSKPTPSKELKKGYHCRGKIQTK